MAENLISRINKSINEINDTSSHLKKKNDYTDTSDFEYIKNKYDLYRYINAKYLKKNKLLKLYKKLEIMDPLLIIKDINILNENRATFVDKFQPGEKYKSIEISIAAENFNIQQGMFNTTDSEGNACSIIKATINDNSKYNNKWLNFGKVLKYSLRNEKEENFSARNFRYKENLLLYTSFIINNPVDVHVFARYEKKVEYTYYGKFVMFEISNDGKSIKLIKKEEVSNFEVQKYNENIDRESKHFVTLGSNDEIYKDTITKTRLKQGLFREQLINKFGDKCMICDIQGKDFVIASHIKPYSKSTVKQAVSVENGLILCPNHDKLFDRGYISFDKDGLIIISKKLPNIVKKETNLHKDISIPTYYKNSKFIEYHRNKIFKE